MTAPARRNHMWSFAGEATQVASTMVTFLALTRVLAIDDFGRYGATLALANQVGALASLGAPTLLVRAVARRTSSRSEALGAAWSHTTAGSVVGFLVLLGLQPVLVPGIDVATYAVLALTQAYVFTLVELGAYASQAAADLRFGAYVRLTSAALRLLALGVFLASGSRSLGMWALVLFGSTVLAAAASSAVVGRHFGAWPTWTAVRWSHIREGAPFAARQSMIAAVDGLDRPLMVRYGHAADNGFYTLGSRIAAVGNLPGLAVAKSSDAEMFRLGARGVASTVPLARRLAMTSAGYTAMFSAGLFVAASLLPHLVSDSYHDAAVVLRWLAFVPVVRCFQLFASNALGAGGRPTLATGALGIATALNLGLNVIVLTRHSWRGAVATTIATEIVYAAMLWAAVVLVSRNESSSPRQP